MGNVSAIYKSGRGEQGGRGRRRTIPGRRPAILCRRRLACVRVQPRPLDPCDFNELLHETLGRLCRRTGRIICRISEPAALILESHDWPAGVTELHAVLAHAVLHGSGPMLVAEDLPVWFIRRVL